MKVNVTQAGDLGQQEWDDVKALSFTEQKGLEVYTKQGAEVLYEPDEWVAFAVENDAP